MVGAGQSETCRADCRARQESMLWSGHRAAQRPGPLRSRASGLPLKACTHIIAGKLLYAESTELHVHHI